NYRKIDRVTDVLTFPAWEGDAILCPPDGYLGDVAICYGRAVAQAKEYGHSLERELAFLAVHGALHLLGYDHMTQKDERVMLQKQTEILNAMGITR
ncbi:MAG: rRNA maturation RNase YbeY, partial [Christensenella sp.]